MKIKILSGRGYNDMKDFPLPLVVEARFFRGHYWVKKADLGLPVLEHEYFFELERVFMPDVVEVL